jgi:stage V sporulation protein G
MANKKSSTAIEFDCLAVTNVQVFPFKEGASLGHMKGMATIVLNDQIQIRGLRIMEGENGMFVGYPIDTFYKGEDYRTVCLPITRQLREHIENCVLEKYHALMDPDMTSKQWLVEYKSTGCIEVKGELNIMALASDTARDEACRQLAIKFGERSLNEIEITSVVQKE